MKKIYDREACASIGRAIHAAGFRLDSAEVTGSQVELGGRKFYVNRGVAYAAYSVTRGYWDSVDESAEPATTRGLDLDTTRV